MRSDCPLASLSLSTWLSLSLSMQNVLQSLRVYQPTLQPSAPSCSEAGRDVSVYKKIPLCFYWLHHLPSSLEFKVLPSFSFYSTLPSSMGEISIYSAAKHVFRTPLPLICAARPLRGALAAAPPVETPVSPSVF